MLASELLNMSKNPPCTPCRCPSRLLQPNRPWLLLPLPWALQSRSRATPDTLRAMCLPAACEGANAERQQNQSHADMAWIC